MENSIFYNPTKIYFGKNIFKECINNELTDYKKILIYYGRKSIKQNGIFNIITSQLEKKGIKYVTLGGVSSNPTIKTAKDGIIFCKKHHIDFILAVGGGSVIDSAKIISIGIPYNDDILNFFKKRAVPHSKIDVGVIVTIPGSGSESNNVAVLTEHNIKLDLTHNLLYPKFAVLDPTYTYTVPYNYTIYGIVDSITHVLERYFTNTYDTLMSDRLCEGIITTLIDCAYKIKDNLHNYSIRAEIMWASKLAHDNLCGIGRKHDWTSHYIANLIGGIYNKPHGAIIGCIMLSWMKYVENLNNKKFIDFGKNIFYLKGNSYDISKKSIYQFENFLKRINAPTKLSEIGIKLTHNDIEFISNNCINKNPSRTIGNYVRLDKNDIKIILTNCKE